MKYILIYATLLIFAFLIDHLLDTPFLHSYPLQGVCDHQLYLNHTPPPHKCIYCFPSNHSQIAFRIQSPLNQDRDIIHQELYQFQNTPYQCTQLVNATQFTQFPILAYNQQIKNQLKQNYSMAYAPFELQRSACHHHNANCSLYIQLQAPSIKVHSYAFFVQTMHPVTAIYYHKNKLKYLEDSFITFLSLLILMFVINQLKEENLHENKLSTYIYNHYVGLVLLVIAIGQPLRPLCFLGEFDEIEWLIGQFIYALAEATFLIYFMQIIAIIKGEGTNLKFIRNCFFAFCVFIPVCLERMVLAYRTYEGVIVDPLVQIDSFDTLLKICWFFFLLYSAIFLFEVKSLLRNQIILLDLLFFPIYAYQKSNFYLGHHDYSHHLFNPVNILAINLYIAMLVSYRDPTLIKFQEVSIELQQTRTSPQHQEVEEDEEQIDTQIDQYYKDA